MSWWLTVVESYPCNACGAEPGEHCQTASGNPTLQPHATRARDSHRCTICGMRLHSEDQGDLCDRHQRVRELELERSRTWKRLHP